MADETHTPSPLATAENAVKLVERSVVKAFKAYVTTPSISNRTALEVALEVAKGAHALTEYRAEFVKVNFS